jgi:anti-sigma B factor antagonist
MIPSARIRVDDEEGIRVVRFLDRQLFDDRTVREVSEQLLGLLPSAGNPPRMVVEFAGVESISSAMLGKMVLLQRRADAAGGQLRLCDVTDPIRSVMRTTNLDRLFHIDRDRRESLEVIRRSIAP